MDTAPPCTCKHRCDRWKSHHRLPCPCLQASQLCTSACQCGHRVGCINRRGTSLLSQTDFLQVEEDTADNQSDEERDEAEDDSYVVHFEDEGDFEISFGGLNTSLQEVLEDENPDMVVMRALPPTETAAGVHEAGGDVDEVTEAIGNLTLAGAKELLSKIARQFPAAIRTILEISLGTLSNAPDPPSPSQHEVPPWCRCGLCRPMDNPRDQVCCRRRHGPCTTVENAGRFNTVILDQDVLLVAIRNRNDILAFRDEPNNVNYRFAAYRQFVLWRWGHLGRYNRVIIPSCVTWKIRDAYPEVDPSLYVGFQPAL